MCIIALSLEGRDMQKIVFAVFKKKRKKKEIVWIEVEKYANGKIFVRR